MKDYYEGGDSENVRTIPRLLNISPLLFCFQTAYKQQWLQIGERHREWGATMLTVSGQPAQEASTLSFPNKSEGHFSLNRKLNIPIIFSPNQPWDCSVLFITFQWLKPLNWITSSRCQPKQIFPIMAELSQVLNEKYWFSRISCRFMCWDADLSVTWHLISGWKDPVPRRDFKKAITGSLSSEKQIKSCVRIPKNI